MRSDTGEAVRGRCRATNLCDYCAKLAAVETTEMLWLDAIEQGSPPLWVLRTTRRTWSARAWKDATEAVWRAVRRRWPAAEYATLIEFTTGYGERSGGLRRPHGNDFVRGVPVEDADELQRVVAAVWCARMDALPEQQRVTRVSEDRGGMRGLTRYVGMHFQKESQAPPKGWRGHRFRTSRGYFGRPVAEMRVQARRSLAIGRAVHRGVEVELAALEVELQADVEWSFVYRVPGVDPQARLRRNARGLIRMSAAAECPGPRCGVPPSPSVTAWGVERGRTSVPLPGSRHQAAPGGGGRA